MNTSSNNWNRICKFCLNTDCTGYPEETELHYCRTAKKNIIKKVDKVMDEKYVDILCDHFRELIQGLPAAKSGLPDGISIILDYRDCTIRLVEEMKYD